MLLSQKQKSFSEFLSKFLNSRLNFEQIQKKDDAHDLYWLGVCLLWKIISNFRSLLS